MEKNQERVPIMEALKAFKARRIVPFDVPGHKRGRGNAVLTEFLGEKCVSVDVNSMKPLDNLCHPISVIKDAEELAAAAFNAHAAFFMVGGTTSSVQAMILASVKRGEKIIMPRNVHRSAINALILCGAVPVYINPKTDDRLGISLGMSPDDVVSAIKKHPDAKAVFLNNPTYYGICSDIKKITSFAHQNGMKVLVDEAHGTHFYFNSKLPMSAMEAGADMSSVSMHKSGGSLTQSSLLLTGEDINADYVRQIVNISQTTSASYLLLSSLDISRRNLALDGEKIFDKILGLSEYAREEINHIGDYYSFSKEIINGDSVYDFDSTKLVVNTFGIGLAGIEVYDILRDEYDIQTEFGDLGNMLCYISVGDKISDIERLVSALSDIKRRYKRDFSRLLKTEYIDPVVSLPPQEAFYADKRPVKLSDSANMVSSEFVMCYPPGIPILAPGELITPEIINYVSYAKEKGCSLLGTEDLDVEFINVIS